MPKPNATRAIVALLREICARRGIALTEFSDDWVFCFQKDGRVAYAFGYDFSVNSAAANLICRDKTATSDLLRFHGIPRVEHRIFHGPQMTGYVPRDGNWRRMLAYFEECDRDVVCKPNDGTGGRDVQRVRSEDALEAAALQLFGKTRSLCMAPYHEILDEYRVVLLRSKVHFVYRKQRPALVGDGRRSVRDLLLARLAAAPDLRGEIQGLAATADERLLAFDHTPAAGERLPLNWRHNLGQGAAPELLAGDAIEALTASRLAVQAAAALDVALASVDVVETKAGWKVLEINSGIMTESLVQAHPEGRQLAAQLYDQIVCVALGLDRP